MAPNPVQDALGYGRPPPAEASEQRRGTERRPQMTKLRKTQGSAASARNRGSPSRSQTATPCTTCTARPARAASRADRGRPWRTSRSMAAELVVPTIRPTASVVRLAVSAAASAGIVVRRPRTSTHSRIARSTGWSRRNAPARQHSLAKASPGSSPATRRRELEKRPRTRASTRSSRSRRPMATEIISGRSGTSRGNRVVRHDQP
jgi:hypothetical protein